jgi:hypothetical protein
LYEFGIDFDILDKINSHFGLLDDELSKLIVGYGVLTAVVMKSFISGILRRVFRRKLTSVFEEHAAYLYLLRAGFLLGLFLDPEDRGDMFLRNR